MQVHNNGWKSSSRVDCGFYWQAATYWGSRRGRLFNLGELSVFCVATQLQKMAWWRGNHVLQSPVFLNLTNGDGCPWKIFELRKLLPTNSIYDFNIHVYTLYLCPFHRKTTQSRMQPCFPQQEITIPALGWHSFLQLSMWVSSILNCIMQRKYSSSLWTVYVSIVWYSRSWISNQESFLMWRYCPSLFQIPACIIWSLHDSDGSGITS